MSVFQTDREEFESPYPLHKDIVMDMDQAAVFLAGSVLVMMGFVVITIGAVAINNIIHKYWKSFGWRFFPEWYQTPHRFVEPHEVDKSNEPKVK